MSFLMSELEFFAKVCHPKFVPLLGHCFEDLNHGFLVYKYMLNKDLSTNMKTDRANGPSIFLDWKMRLKVATEVAQALCHLHYHSVPPLVHGNVEPRSILIDENYDVHLGRLINVCTEIKDRNQNRISRLLRLPKGSLRHTSAASNGTRAYDVYCFGKVLLQLVTGFPVSSNHSNVMDPFLTRDKVRTVAVVAKACLSPKPSKRPLMTDALKALEEYRLEESSSHVGSQSSGQLTIVPEARLTKQKVPVGYEVGGDNLKPRNPVVPGNVNQVEDEWIEQYEPGVYIKLVALRDGTRYLKRLRFSLRRFGEHQVQTWWLENREKVYERYNVDKPSSISGQAASRSEGNVSTTSQI